MKRTQRCFDFTSLEEHSSEIRIDTKRFRTDSDQTDFSTDSDLSDISEKLGSASITPVNSLKSDSLDTDMIKFEFTFRPEKFSRMCDESESSGLGRIIRKSLLEDQ